MDYAGTDAHITIQLLGEKNTSPELLHDDGNDNHERGKFDIISNSHLLTDNVGWINKIRVRNDNSGDHPGWYVNYIKVTDPSNYLSWRVDLNRWISKEYGLDATMDVPIGDITFGDGVLKSVYLGLDLVWDKNDGPSDQIWKPNFSYTYETGTSVNVTTSTTLSGNYSLGASFFGIGGEFSGKMTHCLTQALNTTVRQFVTWNNSFEYTLTPGQAITVANVYFQNILNGEVFAGGVKLNYESRFSLTNSIFIFDGILNQDQVLVELQKVIGLLTPSKKALQLAIPPTILFDEKVPMVNRTKIDLLVKKFPMVRQAQRTIPNVNKVATH